MNFTSTRSKKTRSTKKSKEVLYGNIEKQVQDMPEVLTLNPVNLPEGISKKKELKFRSTRKNKNNGLEKIMWGSEEAESYIKNYIAPEFENEEIQEREARAFAIALMREFNFISPYAYNHMIKDEDDMEYISSASSYISGGRVDSLSTINEFEDICDATVVSKVLHIMTDTITDVPECVTFRDVVNRVGKLAEKAAVHNDKDLPAIVVEPSNIIGGQPGTIFRNEWYRLENAFGNILQGYNYTFYRVPNTNQAMIRILDGSSQLIMFERMIDEGEFLGIGTCMEVPVYVQGRLDFIFCSVKRHPDIIQWSIQNPALAIMEDQLMTIQQDMFTDGSIYEYIDFSSPRGKEEIYPIIDALSKEDFKTLGDNLSKIVHLPWNLDIRMPRVRFEKFSSVNSFELVSDRNTKINYLLGTKEIADGLKITFSDGLIVVTYNGKEINFGEVVNTTNTYNSMTGGLFRGLLF